MLLYPESASAEDVSAVTASDPVNAADAVDAAVVGGDDEEPVYSTVNPFARTGKLVDLDDSTSDG